MFKITKIPPPILHLQRAFSKKKEDPIRLKQILVKRFKQYVEVTDKYHHEQEKEIKETDPELNITEVDSIRSFSIDKYSLTPHTLWLTKGKGMERPFTGEYWHTKDPGHYECAVCSNALFKSDHKFQPPTGMASFWNHNSHAVELIDDIGEVKEDKVNIHPSNEMNSKSEKRRVCCNKCKSHLGVLHADGPPPTFQRYSINSGAMKFIEKAWFKSPVYHQYKKSINRLERQINEATKTGFDRNDVVDKLKFDKGKYYEMHKPTSERQDFGKLGGIKELPEKESASKE